MPLFKRYWLSTLAVILGLTIGNVVVATEQDEFESDRALYAQALDAFRADNLYEFELIQAQISPTYPLYPYLIEMRMRSTLQEYSIGDIRTFKSTYSNTPIATTLEKDWITLQAQNEDWSKIVDLVATNNGGTFACYAIQAQRSTQNKSIDDFDEIIQKLWNVGYSQPKACDLPFAQWIEAGHLSQPLIHSRLLKAMLNDNRALSQYLLSLLESSAEKTTIERWLTLQKNPSLLTNEDLKNSAVLFRDEMAKDLYARLADENAGAAKQLFQTLSSVEWQNSNTLVFIQRSIALHLALTADNDAEQWISTIPSVMQGDALQEWRVRQAMVRNDWPGVLRALEAMEPNLAKNHRWQYWHARALEILGSTEAATEIYKKLSSTLEYYGFLASARLEKPFTLSHEDSPVDPTLIVGISTLPGVMRAYELLQVGQIIEARREWYYVVDRLDMPKRLAAARLASRMGWHHFSLYALHHYNTTNDLSLQYPLGHDTQVLRFSDNLQIDPAWVFSITRQESHFKPDAKSSRGAIGLMQLLPETAKQVALMYQVDYESKWNLIDPNTNIQLGSSYLHHLTQKFSNHLVLATAAYNAGPSKVEEWLPSTLTEADLWIETIPYFETRGYVQKVITNLIMYRGLLGQSLDLKQTLTPIHTALLVDNPKIGKTT